MYIGLHLKYPLFSSEFTETWIFPTDFRKIFGYNNSRKSIQEDPSFSVRTDEQTDMTRLKVAFRNFANAPKVITIYPYSKKLEVSVIFVCRNVTFQCTQHNIIKSYDSWMSLPPRVSWNNINVAGQQLRYAQSEWHVLW